MTGWELCPTSTVSYTGNHDLIFVSKPARARKLLINAVYLENSGVELLGLEFWGCTVTPIDKYTAFAVEYGAASRKYWDKVPG